MADVQSMSSMDSKEENNRKRKFSDDEKSLSTSDKDGGAQSSSITDDGLSIKKRKEAIEREERMKMHRMVTEFSEDQLNRYEMYRRSSFPKAAIKRLVQSISGCTVSQNVVIAMAGVSKVYIGELMETAIDVMEKAGEVPPVKPKHIREALRIIKNEQVVPINKKKQSLF